MGGRREQERLCSGVDGEPDPAVCLGFADRDCRAARYPVAVAPSAGRAVDRRPPRGSVVAGLRRRPHRAAQRRHRCRPGPHAGPSRVRRVRSAAAVPAQGAGRSRTALAAGPSVHRTGRTWLRIRGPRRHRVERARAQLQGPLPQARTDLRADRVRGPVRIPGALHHRAVALRTAGAGARPLPDVAVRAARCARHAGVVLLDPHRAARSARAAAGRRARGVRAQGRARGRSSTPSTAPRSSWGSAIPATPGSSPRC